MNPLSDYIGGAGAQLPLDNHVRSILLYSSAIYLLIIIFNVLHPCVIQMPGCTTVKSRAFISSLSHLGREGENDQEATVVTGAIDIFLSDRFCCNKASDFVVKSREEQACTNKGSRRHVAS